MNIDFEEIKKTLKELKFEYEYSKPFNYDILKPHIKSQVDKKLNRIMSDKIEPIYEVFFNDNMIDSIAKMNDYKMSSEIYKLIIIEKYRIKMYDKFPKEHPLKKSTKYLVASTLLFTIIGLIIGFLIKNEAQVILMFTVLGFGLGLLVGVIIQKIHYVIYFRKN